MMRRAVLCAVGCFILSLSAALAATGDGPATKTYDVRDLLISIPSFTPPDENGAAPGDKAKAKPAETTREEAVAGLIATVRGAFPAEQAKALNISESKGSLVVGGDAASQEVIANLFASLRDRQARQVTLEARIFRFPPAARDKLDDDLRQKLAASSKLNGDVDTGIALSEEEAAALIKQLQANANATQITAPRVTLFSGQRAYVKVATQRAYVAAVHPIQRDGKDDFEAETKNVDSGVMVDARVAMSDDLTHLAVDATTTLRTLVAMDSIDAPNAPGQKIQQPDVLIEKSASLCSIVSGRTVLLGQIHRNRAPISDEQTIVLLKATAIVQVEVEK